MQIIPYQARVRARLGGLPDLSEDPAEYRRQYLAAYAIKVKPFVGGSSPGQGLRDSDLPKGLKYLDPWLIATFAQSAVNMTPLELSKWLMDYPDEDRIQRTRADSRKFAAWAMMRLGAFFRWVHADAAPTQKNTSGDGSNRTRPARDPDAPMPQVFNGKAVYDNYLLAVGQSKDVLAQWADNPPNSAPWNTWPSDPNPIMGIAVAWANAVINRRYGLPLRPGGKFIPVFNSARYYEYAEANVIRLNEQFQEIFDAQDVCSKGAGYAGAAAGAGAASGAGLLATAIILSIFTGGPATVPAWVAVLSAAGVGAVGYGASTETTEFGRKLCAAKSKKDQQDLLQTIWWLIGEREKLFITKQIYAAAFSVPPESVDDRVVADLVGQMDALNYSTAGEVGIFIARPEHDPFLLVALADARDGLVEKIRETFVNTVGCPGRPSTLRGALAERYLASGWTSQDDVRKFLTSVSGFTKAVANGDYCEPIRSANPQIEPVKTSPFPAYADAILGKGRNRTAPTGDGTGPKTTVTPPPPKEEPKGSALPLALVGALGGASVGGPVGAGIGFVLGLVLGNRKA
jgi:hypothetical protein